ALSLKSVASLQSQNGSCRIRRQPDVGMSRRVLATTLHAVHSRRRFVGVASEPERGAPPTPKRLVRLALGGRLGLGRVDRGRVENGGERGKRGNEAKHVSNSHQCKGRSLRHSGQTAGPRTQRASVSDGAP